MKGTTVEKETLALTGLAAEDETLRFDGSFASQALEEAFRQQQTADDLLLAQACCLIGVAGYALFIYIDFHLFGTAGPFTCLLTVRLTAIVISAAAWMGLRRRHAPETTDRLVLTWCLMTGMTSLFLISTRPSTYFGHACVSVGMIILTYSVIPLPLPRQTLSALLYTAGYIVLVFRADQSEGRLLAWASSAACLSANLLGALASWRLQRRRRWFFLTALREKSLRLQLEEALAEVRTLRGLIPICAYCKRVRNEEQVWQQIETYLRYHTDAEFTHGICPGCLRERLAELGETGPR
jgi:hypothetical protein